VTDSQVALVNWAGYQLQSGLAGWREVSHPDETGLKIVAAYPPRLHDVPAPGSGSP